MKTTEDFRKYTAEQAITEREALKKDMAQKSAQKSEKFAEGEPKFTQSVKV